MAKKCVLIIDDDQVLARAILRILGDFYTVRVVLPEEAVDELSCHDYDCVICDVDMPGISGTEILNQIQKTKPEVADRFVYHTGSSCFQAPLGVPVLHKPASVGTIRSTVRQMAMKGVDLFKPLPEGELNDLPPLSKEEIEEALEEGRRAMQEPAHMTPWWPRGWRI